MTAVSSIQNKATNLANNCHVDFGLLAQWCLILDWVILPSSCFGHDDSSWATAGYLIFWNFNRIELLSAALVLTGVLVIITTCVLPTGVVVLLLYPCYWLYL